MMSRVIIAAPWTIVDVDQLGGAIVDKLAELFDEAPEGG